MTEASPTPGDAYLRAILERPTMYVGPSVTTLEVVLLNLLNFRALVFEVDCDPRRILRKTYRNRFGHSAGAGGPASKLIETHGDDPMNEEVVGFYRAFVEAVLKEVPS